MNPPSFWYRPSGFVSTLLAPLSLFYMLGRIVDVMRSVPQPFGNEVIVIGNAVAGGAGKTPTTLALVKLLRAKNVKVQVVTRGYRGTESGPRRIKPGDTAEQVGDEALLLADATSAWVSKNRALGIGCALSAGAEAVLLDDGLQNTKILAGTNILVIDGESGVGNGQMLPAGPLREPLTAILDRVAAVVMIGEDKHNIARLLGSTPMFTAKLSVDPNGLTGQKYVAFSGLARPDKFFASAIGAGLDVAETRAFPDHHMYTPAERDALRQWALTHKAKLLTTAKDAVRYPPALRGDLAVLPLIMTFDDEAAVTDFLLKRIAPHGA